MTDWLTNWLTEALGLSRHSKTWGTHGTQGTQGTQGTWRALGNSGTRDTWALGHWGHSGTRRALEHLGTQGTWVFRHSKGTWALRHSSTGVTFFSRLNQFNVYGAKKTLSKTLAEHVVLTFKLKDRFLR